MHDHVVVVDHLDLDDAGEVVEEVRSLIGILHPGHRSGYRPGVECLAVMEGDPLTQPELERGVGRERELGRQQRNELALVAERDQAVEDGLREGLGDDLLGEVGVEVLNIPVDRDAKCSRWPHFSRRGRLLLWSLSRGSGLRGRDGSRLGLCPGCVCIGLGCFKCRLELGHHLWVHRALGFGHGSLEGCLGLGCCGSSRVSLSGGRIGLRLGSGGVGLSLRERGVGRAGVRSGRFVVSAGRRYEREDGQSRDYAPELHRCSPRCVVYVPLIAVTALASGSAAATWPTLLQQPPVRQGGRAGGMPVGSAGAEAERVGSNS